ncbi:MAG: hypothetical protein R2733_10570 [Acidimicrobiales bacterium]
MRMWRMFFTGVLLTTLVSTRPAAAEVATPQSTSWGLATEGPTDNIDRWVALGWATEAVDGMMIVGGKFLDTTNGGQSYRQPYLAAFDAGSGDFLTWWRPDVGGAVTALETTPDGGLVVGGEMDEWEGATVGALQKIDPATGEVWPGWNTRVYGGSSIIRDLRLEPDGYLYAVGSFTTATDGGAPFAVNGAVRMDPTTGIIDRNWLPQPAGSSIWGVSVSRTTNEVYLAGWFTSMNGAPNTRGFAGVSSVDASLIHDRSTIPFNTCVGCTNYHRLYDVVATEYGTVFVGGEQHGLFILDESDDLDMQLMHYTGCNRAVTADCSRAGGEYQEIERIGDRIYATCHCWGDHMTSNQVIYHSSFPSGSYTGRISGIAAYDPLSGQRIQSFEPYMAGTAGGFAIAGTTDGCVWTAGGYTAVGTPGNQLAGRDLVRLCDEAGPGPAPTPSPTPPAPTSCVATVVGTTVTITWTTPPLAESTIVHRQVGVNGTYSWRARVSSPTSTFTENAPTGEITTYQVTARYPGLLYSEPVTCAPPIDLTAPVVDDVLPPASCHATNNGTAATITWTPSDNATDYRVYRTIDGSPNYWRGLTTNTSFDDTLRTSGTHTYTVQARGITGVWSTSTECTPALTP